jgi:hypothetical protein
MLPQARPQTKSRRGYRLALLPVCERELRPREVVGLEVERREVERERDEELRDGTLAPFSRASDSPIAIACLRLVTRPPCPDFPLFSVPCFLRRIALSTDLEAASP